MNLDSKALALKIAEAAWEKKAYDLRILDVNEQFQLSDYFIICSGRSDRQVVAIADAIGEALHKVGVRPLSVEGTRWGRWVCIDCEDVVVHVFYHDVRELYALESVWSESPVLPVTPPEWVENSVGFQP